MRIVMLSLETITVTNILNSMNRSDQFFFVSAFFSFLFSIYLWFNGQQQEGIFVGIWVPSILSAAILIKQITNQKNQNP